MNNGTSGGGTVVVGPLDPIGDAPINDAHGFAEETLNMMQEWYGHNSIDDNGFVIRSRVHYSHQLRERVLGRHPDDLRRRRQHLLPAVG